MKRELIPYYVSRAALAALFGFVAACPGQQPWWHGLLMAVVVFAGFVWYAHSGRYEIDPTTPLMPLRRDERGRAIRDRAVVWAVGIGGVLFAVLSLAGPALQVSIAAGTWAFLAGVISYFAVSNWMYIRDA